MADTDAKDITELKAITERLSRRLDEIKAMDSAILSALAKTKRLVKKLKLKILLPLEGLYGNGVFHLKLKGVNLKSLKTCQNLISALRGIY